jgi:hypothetical protein
MAKESTVVLQAKDLLLFLQTIVTRRLVGCVNCAPQNILAMPVHMTICPTSKRFTSVC